MHLTSCRQNEHIYWLILWKTFSAQISSVEAMLRRLQQKSVIFFLGNIHCWKLKTAETWCCGSWSIVPWPCPKCSKSQILCFIFAKLSFTYFWTFLQHSLLSPSLSGIWQYDIAHRNQFCCSIRHPMCSWGFLVKVGWQSRESGDIQPNNGVHFCKRTLSSSTTMLHHWVCAWIWPELLLHLARAGLHCQSSTLTQPSFPN